MVIVNGLATIDSIGMLLKNHVTIVQPDNKILVAGYTEEMFGPYYIKIARFNADGTIDEGFGTNGSVTVSGYYPRAIAVQPDGKIIIVGADNKLNSLTMRLLPNGTLDMGFGTNGIVSTSFGSTSAAHAVAIQQDGKIVVAGQYRWIRHTVFFLKPVSQFRWFTRSEFRHKWKNNLQL